MGKRVAVLTDSNSGITQEQGKILWLRVLGNILFKNIDVCIAPYQRIAGR